MLLQQFGSLSRSDGVSFTVVCEGHEWGEWVYEEGGKGSGFVFFTFVVDVIRRPPQLSLLCIIYHRQRRHRHYGVSPYHEPDLPPPLPLKRKR